MGLILHETDFGVGSPNEYAFSKHEVDTIDNCVSLGPGRFMSAGDLAQLVEVLIRSRPGQFAYLPPDILGISATQLAWYTPPSIRPMWFRSGDHRRKLIVPWPALLWRARPGQLSVAALDDPNRPKPDQALFHAPLMNISERGVLCPGSAVLPPSCDLEHRLAYEQCVFDTAFTHVSHEKTLKLSGAKAVDSTGHLKFWRALERRGARRFPGKALVPLNQRVTMWLSGH